MTDELFLFRKHHCQHEVKWRSGFIEDKLTRHCTIGRIVHFEIKLDYGFKMVHILQLLIRRPRFRRD